MNRAQYLIERLDTIAEEYDHYKAITPDDTIIQNQTKHLDGVVPQCPTCGRDLIPGFVYPSQIQCPKCQTDVSLAKGEFPYRTLSGNRVAADGVVSKGTYGEQV